MTKTYEMTIEITTGTLAGMTITKTTTVYKAAGTIIEPHAWTGPGYRVISCTQI